MSSCGSTWDMYLRVAREPRCVLGPWVDERTTSPLAIFGSPDSAAMAGPARRVAISAGRALEALDRELLDLHGKPAWKQNRARLSELLVDFCSSRSWGSSPEQEGEPTFVWADKLLWPYRAYFRLHCGEDLKVNPGTVFERRFEPHSAISMQAGHGHSSAFHIRPSMFAWDRAGSPSFVRRSLVSVVTRNDKPRAALTSQMLVPGLGKSSDWDGAIAPTLLRRARPLYRDRHGTPTFLRPAGAYTVVDPVGVVDVALLRMSRMFLVNRRQDMYVGSVIVGIDRESARLTHIQTLCDAAWSGPLDGRREGLWLAANE